MATIKEITNFRSYHNVLVRPLTVKQLTQRSTKQNIISEKVLISFNDLVDNNGEWLNDEVSEKITGSIAGLMNIQYKVAGRTTSNEVILKVSGEINFNLLT